MLSLLYVTETAREREQKVLVHCKAGISRSATICLAYLMWYHKWTLEQAYDFLKAKRRLISPNLNFMRQLLEFEQQLQTSREWENGKGGGVGSSEQLLALSKNGLESAPPAYPPHVAPITTTGATTMGATGVTTYRTTSHRQRGQCDFGQHPASARPALSLPLTPCGAQAAVFSFPDIKTHTPSPPQMVCRSPLLSPS